ncbi:hypothetical protein [Polyangium aurulentum]|uniref:hypothetical protein n=1 Tax=Polyangium aurulentum TaxID=2567896 RepID=UPI0010AE7199|nr:hypothetical protein [Polyangium aurulentum]UQA58199.1 hypothetical protein E8A73_044270 [Polyangium aurulentum]
MKRELQARDALGVEREDLERDRARLSEARFGRELRVPLRGQAGRLWVSAFGLGALGALAIGWGARVFGVGARGLVSVSLGAVLVGCSLFAALAALRAARRSGRALVLGKDAIELPTASGETVSVSYEDIDGVVLVPGRGRLVHALRTRGELIPLPIEDLPRAWAAANLPLRVHVRAALSKRRPRLGAAQIAAIEAQVAVGGDSLGVAVAMRDGEPEVVAVIRDEAHWGALLVSGALPEGCVICGAADVEEPLGDALKDAIGAMVKVAEAEGRGR